MGLAQGAVVRVLVGGMFVAVGLTVVVRVGVTVAVRVTVAVTVMMMSLGDLGSLFPLEHDFQAGTIEGAADHATDLEAPTIDPEALEPGRQVVDGKSGVDERSEDHVATGAARGLEVGDARHQVGRV